MPSSRETATLEKLGNAVHGITRPFVCGGSLVPAAPVAIDFKGEHVAFDNLRRGADEEKALSALLAACREAPFGKGSKTLYDRRIREALELRAEGGTFSVLGFDPAATGVLEQVQRQLCPEDPSRLTAELYNLNVYHSGGHFVPHKDTPRGSDMLGTLVVCLPTYFYGGQLVVSHGTARKVFDWGRQISRQEEPSRIHWAAFFGDVDHSIREVIAGRRITLSYVLRRGEVVCPPPPPGGTVSERLQDVIEEALSDSRFFPRGVTLGFPCFHLYSEQAAFQKLGTGPLTQGSAYQLKGRDYDVAAAAMRAELSVRLEPYLIENCGGGRWRLKKFPSDADRRRLGDQITPSDLEKALSPTSSSEEDEDLGVRWVLAPPGAETPLGSRKGEGESSECRPCSERFHSCDYSPTGYFGNEGSQTDFYLYAALHVAVPAWGKSPRTASRAAINPRRKRSQRRRTKA